MEERKKNLCAMIPESLHKKERWQTESGHWHFRYQRSFFRG